ncbi:MAG: hypothetical protein E7Z88_08735 [Cyanobacteria bacterium SIG27]|nr:hypothetical protein [Cyanobacteria bacterium SIG27]
MDFIKKNNTLFSIIFALLAFFGISIVTSAFTYSERYFTNNIFSYISILGYFYICKQSLKILNKRLLKYSLFFAISFSIALTFGYNLYWHLTVFKLNTILAIITLSPFLTLITALLIQGSEILEEKIKNLKFSKKIDEIFFKGDKKSFWFCFLFILLCHIPAFLAYYPGIFSYDLLFQIVFFSKDEWIEIHPLLHNLILLTAITINKLSNSDTLGVLCYTIFQTSIIFSIYSYCINVLSKYKANFYIKVFALLFFALHPMSHLFSIISTKDVLFSTFILFFVVQLFELFQNKANYLNSSKNRIKLIVTIFLMFTLRHNGFCSYLLFLPILLFFNKQQLKKALIVFLMPVILFFIYGEFKKSAGIRPAPIASSIGIPLQQMARVRKIDKNLDKKDIETFKTLVGKEREMKYHPMTVDPIKVDTNYLHSDTIQKALEENPIPYIKLWIKWGLQNPKEYVNAFLSNNYTYWYPNMNYIYIYPHNFIVTRNPWDNILGVKIKQESKIPKLKKLYDKLFLYTDFEKIPLFSSLNSMSFNIWLNILAFFIILYKRKYNFAIPLIFNFIALFLVLFGPLALCRYIYFNYLLVPFFIFAALAEFKNNDKEEKNIVE